MGTACDYKGHIRPKSKSKLAEYAAKLREEWMEEKKATKLQWGSKKKKHVIPNPSWGYIKRTVDDNFPLLRKLSRDVSAFQSLHICISH